MILEIPQIIDHTTVEGLLRSLSKDEIWLDGAESASGRALHAKSNLQARVASSPVKNTLDTIQRALARNRLFNMAAYPAGFSRILLNRYDAGMYYRRHVDAAYMGGTRTDISFTLFLSPPEAYDGGELMLDHVGSQGKVKLLSGSMIMYPSGTPHSVAEITSGSRVCCVGWVKSRIRSHESRNLLFELERSLIELQSRQGAETTLERLTNLRNNLIRRWGE